VGCGNNIYLEEFESDGSENVPVEQEFNIAKLQQTSSVDFKNAQENKVEQPEQSGQSKKIVKSSPQRIHSSESKGKKFLLEQISPLVEHLTKLATLKERNVISENEFSFIKTELIKKLAK